MKTVITVVMAMIASTAAQADGFKCVGENTGLNFKMYNHVHAAAGTRNAAIMIVSDPSIGYGNKTIATFTDAKSTISNSGASYKGKVDLRVLESSRKGENIAGTKLGELEKIVVRIGFNYFSDTPSLNGSEMNGLVGYYKRNGEILQERLSCVRYKKN